MNVTQTTTFTLTAVGTNNTATCTETVTVNPPGTDPDISIIKRDAEDKDDIQTVPSGGTAVFEIVVTNTGNEDLKNVVVTDPLAPDCDRTIGDLAIGDSVTYTCEDPGITADYTNTANVVGESVVDDQEVTDSDPSDVNVPTQTGLSCD